MKKRMDLKTLSVMTTAVGTALIVMNFTYLSKYPQVFSLLNLLAGIVILGVPLTYRYFTYNKLKKIESIFPVFLKPLTKHKQS